MKLFEVFDKDSGVEDWEHRNYDKSSDDYQTSIDDELVNLQFANLENLQSYFDMMHKHAMISDASATYESTIEEYPELKDWSNIVNVGFGVGYDTNRQNWSDPKMIYKILSSIVHRVLKYSKEHSDKKYVFGSSDHKKALLFYRMIRKYTKNVYVVKNPEGSNNHTFVFAHS